MSDWVAIGSYISLAVSIVVFVFLVVKVRKLMNTDKSDD